jgi:Flp pilus assembly pilin Flp
MAQSGHDVGNSRGTYSRSNSRIQYSCNHHGTSHCTSRKNKGNSQLMMQRLWSQQDGQDIAEYAVMMAVILVLVAGTVRLIGSSATNTFATVGSSIAQ